MARLHHMDSENSSDDYSREDPNKVRSLLNHLQGPEYVLEADINSLNAVLYSEAGGTPIYEFNIECIKVPYLQAGRINTESITDVARIRNMIDKGDFVEDSAPFAIHVVAGSHYSEYVYKVTMVKNELHPGALDYFEIIGR